MFRCFNCGKSFDNDEILEMHETLGTIKEPPYEVSYVCPHCKSNEYRPFIKDRVSRRKVIEVLIDVMLLLNDFDEKICAALNSTATDNTGLDFGRSKLFGFLVSLAENEDFDLPRNIDEKIFDMENAVQASEVEKTLTKNIEGE